MTSRSPWALSATLVLVLATAISNGQEREPESIVLPDPATTKSSLDLQQKDAMAEILRIRRSHGDLLAGSIFADLTEDSDDSTAQTEETDPFAQALQRVMQRAPATTSQLVEQPAGSELTQRCEAAYAQATDVASAEEAIEEAIEDTPYSRSLRRSARLLDRRADDLDAERQFVEADRLRELATQLRAEAREIPTLRTARSK